MSILLFINLVINGCGTDEKTSIAPKHKPLPSNSCDTDEKTNKAQTNKTASPNVPLLVQPGTTVTLDGDCDLHGLLTYQWAFILLPENSTAKLLNTESITPCFAADAEGTYLINLTIKDSGQTVFDSGYIVYARNFAVRDDGGSSKIPQDLPIQWATPPK